ncbi:MAG: hypothetical protein ACE5IM_02940 [Nitrospinota bacterium]
MPRIPYCDEAETPPEMVPLFEESERQWGTRPRYFRLFGHAPAFVEAWQLIDRKLRLDRLAAGDRDFVRLEELVILKTSYLNACSN